MDFKKLLLKYKAIVIYLVLGLLTTVVNYAVYLPLYNLLGISAAVSNVVAWVFAVLFAFVTNKPFAFESHDWTMSTVLPEFTRFVGCRVGSGLLETGIIFLLVDCLLMNGNVIKLITSVLVVLLNYFASKFFVFKK